MDFLLTIGLFAGLFFAVKLDILILEFKNLNLSVV